MNSVRQIVVSVANQSLTLLEDGQITFSCPVSTSSRGTGFEPGSFRTPTGNFRIHQKIGHGQPLGTIFSARSPVGLWHPGTHSEDDLILTRILQLAGTDPENANTLDRYIYFHGTNHESLIGTPASHGCVRLKNDDMLHLFDLVAEQDAVIILPKSFSLKGFH